MDRYKYLFQEAVVNYSITPNKYKKIKEVYGDFRTGLADSFNKIVPKLKFTKSEHSISIENYYKQEGIEFITIEENQYPSQLLDLDQPPLVLYYKGDMELLKYTGNMITVVGARKITTYGEYLLNTLLSKACQNSDLGVVSGLAYGVDRQSHEVALRNNSKTIGVIGGGLDKANFYPSSNYNLMIEIINKGGLVLSEYPPGTQAQRYNFPARNRILAAITDVTWIVQAALKSGSLITASEGLEIGREVVTSSANLNSVVFEGNIELIKNGSQLITSYKDLISLVGLNEKDDIKSIEYKGILKLLDTSKSIQTLQNEYQKEASEILSELTLLELDNKVKQDTEGNWIRV